MKFFYQIFVVNSSVTHETAPSSKEVKTSSNNNNNNNSNSPLFNVNSNDNSNNHNKKYQNNQQQSQYNSNIQTKSNSSIENSLENAANVEQLIEANNKISNFNNDNSNSSSDSSSGRSNKSEAKIVRFGSVKTTKSNKNATKAVASTSTAQKGKNIDVSASATDDSCYSFSDEKPLKVAFVSTKNAKGSKTYNILPANNGNMSPSVQLNKPDMKSLRSNAAYNNAMNAINAANNDSGDSGSVTAHDSKFSSPKTSAVKTETPKEKSALKQYSEAKNKNKTTANEGKVNRNGNAILNSPNIVVSIPQSRRVSFSDDVFENISLAELKTANKKTKSGSSPKSDNYVEEERRELPKLKIDLANLKAKYTSAKNKERAKKELESSQSTESVLDYVGLKPISPSESSRSPDSKSEDNVEHGHKKRKKSGKHSKEPGSKRRKLHAEISSQEEESLKLKVKITGGKPSKHERKNSSVSSDDNSSNSSTLSDSKDVDSPTAKSPRSSTMVDKIQLPKRSTRTPPNASPARPNIANDDDKEDVVFVSSSIESNHKPMKFVPWKDTQKPPVPKLNSTPNVQPVFAVPVGKPKVAKPQPVADFRSRGVFSPPHIPNYPPFHLPAPKVVAASPHLTPINAPVKRSTSADSRPDPPKQPKVDKQPVRKNSIPNLIKATMPIKNNAAANKPPKPNEIFYNSSMSSKYTSEIHTKKPLPMLLPPASVSVTEISDSESQGGAFASGSLVGRPALEIVRISSNVPTVDQQHKQVEKLRQHQQQQLAAQTQKSNRPMPSTIPLLKIKNAGNQMRANAKESAGEGTGVLDLSGRSSRSPSHSPSPPANNARQLNVTSSATLPRLVTVSTPNTNNTQSMTIKSSPMSIASNFNKNINNYMSRILPRNTNTVPTSIASASLTNNRGNMDGKNAATSRDKLQSPPPLLSMMPQMLSLNAARQLQIPKLNEIGKSRPNGPVRQQNASVRNVPNPSALAFRNQSVQQHQQQQQQNSTERSSPPTAVSVASITASTGSVTSGSKAQSPTLPAGNRTPTRTGASIDVTTSMGRTPTSNNTISTTTTASALLLSSLMPISKQLKAPTLSKHNLLISGADYMGVGGSGRNNNNDIIDAKLIAAKKNQHTSIEGVVANLRAAAQAASPQRLSVNSVPKGSVTSLSS